ncbi:MAG: biotin transporter BioY [Ignavibacteriales bacterium]|nr:MAG: biotin transporter BioY [Ignavibacteriales bacterium]
MNTNETVRIESFKNIFRRTIENKIVWVLSFTFLTAIASQFAIPVKPVPFTLQTIAVLLAGAVLGAKRGALSQLIYLALGITGLPVFAQTPDGALGFARLLGPTGGYLLAFPIAAYLTGRLIEINKSYITVVSSMFFGSIVIIFFGTIYLHLLFLNDFAQAVKAGAAVFTIWTVVKVFAATAIYFGITKRNSDKS